MAPDEDPRHDHLDAEHVCGCGPQRRSHPPRRPPLLLAGLLVLAALGALGTAGTFASWNDQAAVQGGTVTSGTLDLTVNGNDGSPTPVDLPGLGAADLTPGESKAVLLTVHNAGTVPFRARADGRATGTGDLAGSLVVRVVPGGAPSTDTTYPRQETCSGTAEFTGTLGAGSTAVLPEGTIGPGGSQAVCVQVTLDPDADNSLQGRSYVPTLVFTATQVIG